MSKTENASPIIWRQMHESDLGEVHRISQIIHPDFPEDIAVFADRLAVFPSGALVLEGENGLLGYSFSHPWTRNSAPALNILLEQLPKDAGSYYLHDVALLQEARAFGAGRKLVETLLDIAKTYGFDSLSLVAVNGSQPYWQARGFNVQDLPHLREKLRSYSDDACFMTRNITNA